MVNAPAPAAAHPRKPHLRGVSHQVAAIVAATLAPVMIVRAPGVAPRFIVALYAVAIVALFGVSALYHRGRWGEKGLAVMRRLDHSMIFVAIAATYTPIAAFVFPTRTTTIVLVLVWFGAAAGAALRLWWSGAPYWVVALPYLAVGWVGVIALGDIWRGLGVAGFTLIVVGAGLFTLGAVIYALHWPNPWPRWFGYHEIFHAFVIAGITVHYVVVAFYAVPQAT
ncbi:MAG: hemolysin III family protein [Actinomycetota bacterium]|nr:hemolysin III family protein [Actinomycetota bacterium]